MVEHAFHAVKQVTVCYKRRSAHTDASTLLVTVCYLTQDCLVQPWPRCEADFTGVAPNYEVLPMRASLLAALAVEECRWLEAERSEDRRVEGERPLEVTAHEVDVTEADQHRLAGFSRASASSRQRPSRRTHAELPALESWAPQTALGCSVRAAS